jgi:hypothetical protein
MLLMISRLLIKKKKSKLSLLVVCNNVTSPIVLLFIYTIWSIKRSKGIVISSLKGHAIHWIWITLSNPASIYSAKCGLYVLKKFLYSQDNS